MQVSLGKPTTQLLKEDSSTMVNRKGLRHEPWWTSTFAPYSRHKTNKTYTTIPISCIDTTDLYDVGESNSNSLRDIAKCSTLAYENIPLLESWDMKMQIIHMCQETLRHLDIWLPLLFWTNTSNPSELSTQKDIVIWIMWSSYSFRFLEQSVIISNLIPVRKVPYPNLYLK